MTSLAIQWLRIYLGMQGMQIQSLAGELRSHMLWSNQALTPQLEGSPSDSAVKNMPAMQETQFRSLIRKDPTCHRATKPV